MAGRQGCTVCSHPEREAIDAGLASGALSVRTAAARYGLGRSTVGRHRQLHLPPSLIQLDQAETARVVETARDRLERLLPRAERLLERAERSKRTRDATMALRELRAAIELLAKLTGELHERSTTINIVGSAEWAELRQLIGRALLPYPDARRAVVDAVSVVEERAGS
jgi:hypothetical protein